MAAWGEGSHIFGGVSVKSSGGETVTINDIGVYVQFTGFDRNTESNGCTPDHSNDHITVLVAGVYRIHADAAFRLTQGDEAHLEVKKNNGATTLEDIHSRTNGRGVSDESNCSCHGYATLAAADTVELWMENATSTDNLLVHDATMTIELVELT